MIFASSHFADSYFHQLAHSLAICNLHYSHAELLTITQPYHVVLSSKLPGIYSLSFIPYLHYLYIVNSTLFFPELSSYITYSRIHFSVHLIYTAPTVFPFTESQNVHTIQSTYLFLKVL